MLNFYVPEKSLCIHYTLPKFWWYNKAGLEELVRLEILGQQQQGLPAWYFLWSVQGFDQMLR